MSSRATKRAARRAPAKVKKIQTPQVNLTPREQMIRRVGALDTMIEATQGRLSALAQERDGIVRELAKPQEAKPEPAAE